MWRSSARTFTTTLSVAVSLSMSLTILSTAGPVYATAAPAEGTATATVSGVLRSPEFPNRPALGQHSVSVYSYPYGGAVSLSATPDAHGRFTISGVPAGKYTIRIESSTESWTIGESGGIDPGDNGVNLEAGQNFVVDTTVPFERNPLTPTTVRIAGEDRFDTAVQVSRSAFDAGVSAVYLVSGADFADALSAAPAAAYEGGPLLLTTPGGLPQTVRDELVRLTPEKVVIVGGIAAVSTTVEAQVQSLGLFVQRVSGADRFATSLAVAQYIPRSSCSAAFIATGLNYPDALSLSPVAANFREPLILVDGSSSSLPTAAKDALQDMNCLSVMIAGGPKAVSTGIESSVRTLASSVTRFAGDSRYGTSEAINRFTGAHPHAYFASGENFPDALTAAVVAGRGDGSLYLTRQYCVPAPLHGLVVSRTPAVVTLVGGSSVLHESIASPYSSPC
jgi:putative cell wall-binding protein